MLVVCKQSQGVLWGGGTMRKSTIVAVAIVYIASIVIISLFGMKSVVYNEVIPVSAIECLNKTEGKTQVKLDGDTKVISIKFDKPGNAETLTGTMVQLNWRVLPDNASNKKVKFILSQSSRAQMIKDESGNDLGLIIFTGKVVLNVRIMSTDGTRIYEDLIVWAY